MRSRLIVVAVVSLVCSSCGRMPTAQEANDAVWTLREYESWAWAVGIAFIWADVVLPVPQTAVIAALGIIYGTVLGALLGSVGLITGGLLGYVLMLTSARRYVPRIIGARSAQIGATVRRRRSLGDRPDPQPAVQRPRGHGVSRRPCGYADWKIPRGGDRWQCAYGDRLCRHWRRLG
jgi:hypothetical protein